MTIRFGTDGWRAVISETFTFANLRLLAQAIADLGPRHVLVKGGHLRGPAQDVFWSRGVIQHLPGPRIDTKNTHGTGCVLSAAITARLARGDDVITAVQGAKRFIASAIRTNPGLGSGCGPVNLHASASGETPP